MLFRVSSPGAKNPAGLQRLDIDSKRNRRGKSRACFFYGRLLIYLLI